MRGEAFPLARATRPADLVAAWAAELQTGSGGNQQPVPDMALDIEELTRKVGGPKLTTPAWKEEIEDNEGMKMSSAALLQRTESRAYVN